MPKYLDMIFNMNSVVSKAVEKAGSGIKNSELENWSMIARMVVIFHEGGDL